MKTWHQSSSYIVLLAAVLSLLFVNHGYAQEDPARFPSRPLTFIVSLPPGGTTDMACRLISKQAEKYLKQPVVVLNKPGGTLTIGISAIATSKPDGYTIGFSGGPPFFMTPLIQKVPYDPIKDFRMVLQFAGFNFGIFVRQDSPFKTFKDLVEYARQNPKKVTYGTAGQNSPANVTTELIARKANVRFTHIPFKGEADVQTAVLGGHLIFGAVAFNYSLVEAKQIRVLLLLRDEASAEYPDVPIMKDLGYDFPFPLAIGVACPKATPDGIVRKIDEAYAKGMKEHEFLAGMKELHLPVFYRSSKDLEDYIPQNYEFYKKHLKELGVIK